MFSKYRALIALSAILAAAPVDAQYQGKLAVDASIFGTGGFTAVPALDSSNPAITPVGFVRMPLSGGYVYFSIQQIGATKRLVATRFASNGALDIFWGQPANPGSITYGLPLPVSQVVGGPSPLPAGSIEMANAKAAVVVEGTPARERIYLAMKYLSGPAHYLGVARFDFDGTFLSFDSTNLMSWFAGVSFVQAVASSNNLYSGSPGLLVAVSGFGGATGPGSALVRVIDGIILANPFITPLAPIILPGQEITQLVFHPHGKADVVGREAGMALYREYNPISHTVSIKRTFALPCPDGAHADSKIDGIVRPAEFSPNDGLVVGRVNCTTASHLMLARVTNIGISPIVAWGTSIGGVPGACGILSFNLPCLTSYLAMSSSQPGRALLTTTFRDSLSNPFPALAHVDITSVPGRVLGLDALYSPSFGMIAPTFVSGTDYADPYLVGFGYRGPSSIGFGSVAVDRIFASGMGVEWW